MRGRKLTVSAVCAKSKISAHLFVGHTSHMENRGSPNFRGHIIKQHFGASILKCCVAHNSILYYIIELTW